MIGSEVKPWGQVSDIEKSGYILLNSAKENKNIVEVSKEQMLTY